MNHGNPWWGDPSFRILPRTATGNDVNLYHLHVTPRIAEQDLNTFMPLQRLNEMEAQGEIGRSAAHHYSYMGYILQPKKLMNESVPDMIQSMKQDGVNLVILIPV